VTLFELFQPGLKYLREEKARQRMLVSKPTHGGGAPLGIDLDAGTAKITIRPKASTGLRDASDADGDQIAPDPPNADDADSVAQRRHTGGNAKDDTAS
jgi:uncharacterized protein DUF6191